MRTKILFIITAFLISSCLYSQTDLNNKERNRPIAITLTQDGRLTFFKDDAGNVPFTLDLTLKFELRSYSTRHGYFSLIPNFEYAQLSGGDFLSYGAWAAYTFDEFIHLPTFGALNEDFIDIDLTPYAGANLVNRKWRGNSAWTGYNKPSIHFGLETTFKVHDRVGIVWDFKWNQRTDLMAEYSSFDEEFSFNFGFGVKYEFN